ncbi:MAG: sulfite exporter TauE/SafE family protein [Clostridiales bacterium]|jgi:uncharacterized membrane protein YfcA|nr:sulfite exporter TauE/SafE family protein [Clostridiales bacterium]
MNKQKNTLVAVLGAAIGFINGLLGSGGGSVAVPAMKRLLGVETRRAHASAVAVILPLSAVSLLAYSKAAQANLGGLALVAIGGTAGGMIGAKLTGKLPRGVISKIFSICMVTAAVKMVAS